MIDCVLDCLVNFLFVLLSQVNDEMVKGKLVHDPHLPAIDFLGKKHSFFRRDGNLGVLALLDLLIDEFFSW